MFVYNICTMSGVANANDSTPSLCCAHLNSHTYCKQFMALCVVYVNVQGLTGSHTDSQLRTDYTLTKEAKGGER